MNEYVAMLVVDKARHVDKSMFETLGPIQVGPNINGFTSLYVRKGELKTVDVEKLEKTLLSLNLKREIKDFHITNKLRQD